MTKRSAILWLAIFFPALALLGIIANSTNLFHEHGILYRFQTIIAGLFAIGAAFIGGRYIREQIATADRHEQERLRRRFDAARAVLPLALSYLMEFTEDLASAMVALHGAAVGGSIPSGTVMPATPSLPQDLITQFREMIDASEAEIGAVIANLLSKLQVLTARIRSLERNLADPSHIVMVDNVEGRIIDIAEVHALSAGLFDFARRRGAASGILTQNHIHASLNLLGLWDVTFPGLYTSVSKRFPP